MRVIFRTALISIFLTSTALADTWTVDDDGKADFDNIQAAVDASSDGDEIVVMPGTYTGSGDQVVDMLGKAVTLRSSDPSDPDVAATTIIDGEGVRRGIYCGNGETSKTSIEGFTITGGYINNNRGGGMYSYNSNPALTYCTFTNNTATHGGGGMYNYGSSPTLENCMFENNNAESYGGGMWNINSSPTLTNCTFTSNTADYYDGGGMYNYDNCNPTLTNCTFTSNTATFGGGMYSYNSSSPALTDTTVCGNSPNQISGAWTDNGGNTIADVCPWDCPADVNQDGVVDVTDILALVGAWGSSGPLGDINDDGTVNVVDLIMMLKSWGACE